MMLACPCGSERVAEAYMRSTRQSIARSIKQNKSWRGIVYREEYRYDDSGIDCGHLRSEAC